MSALDPVEIEFCRRIRVVRMALGLSVRELAAKSGVGFNTISRHERLIAKPQLGTCERLAQALGHSLCSLLADEGVTAALAHMADADASRREAKAKITGKDPT